MVRQVKALPLVIVRPAGSVVVMSLFVLLGEPVIFDVDGQTNSEIMSRLIKTLGKTRETLEKEALASEKKDNPANFGVGFDRYCICMVSGQVPCPGVVQLPKHWRGKYAFGLVDEEDE